MSAASGFFDDLLNRPSKRRPSTAFESGLVALALSRLDADGPPAPRLHTCLRCEQIADREEAVGEPRPPVHECESWLFQGRRYYAATCRACTDWEWARYWQARYDAANGKGDGAKINIGEQRRLTELAHARQAAGRDVPLHLPTGNGP
jgi:hypothetical protein